jgi:hypothetical protein
MHEGFANGFFVIVLHLLYLGKTINATMVGCEVEVK